MATNHDEVPPGLATALTVLVGMPWPEGSVSGLRRLSRAYRDFNTVLEQVPDALRRAGAQVADGMDGSASERQIAYLGNDLRTSVDGVIDAVEQLRGMTLDSAADIEEARAMIIIQLVILLAAIAHLIATIFGAIFIPVVVAAARIAIQIIWTILIELVEELILGTLVPLAINGIQVALGHRTHIDAQKMLQNLYLSLFSGFTAGLGRSIAGGLTKFVAGRRGGSTILRLPDGSKLATGWANKTLYFANNAFWQAAGGGLAGALEYGLTGEFNWGSVTAAASAGFAEGTSKPSAMLLKLELLAGMVLKPPSDQLSLFSEPPPPYVENEAGEFTALTDAKSAAGPGDPAAWIGQGLALSAGATNLVQAAAVAATVGSRLDGGAAPSATEAEAWADALGFSGAERAELDSALTDGPLASAVVAGPEVVAAVAEALAGGQAGALSPAQAATVADLLGIPAADRPGFVEALAQGGVRTILDQALASTWSPSELAAAAGVSPELIQQLAGTGPASITPAQAAGLADALGLTGPERAGFVLGASGTGWAVSTVLGTEASVATGGTTSAQMPPGLATSGTVAAVTAVSTGDSPATPSVPQQAELPPTVSDPGLDHTPATEPVAVELSPMPAATASRSYGWLARVNPLGALTNCVLAAIAVDMSVREGAPHQAPVTKASPAGHLQRYAGRKLVGVSGWDAVRAGMTAAGPGARGIVVVGGPDGLAAHAFNVVHDRNGVVFLDGQRGGPARGPARPHTLEFVLTAEGTGTVPDHLLVGASNQATASLVASGVPVGSSTAVGAPVGTESTAETVPEPKTAEPKTVEPKAPEPTVPDPKAAEATAPVPDATVSVPTAVAEPGPATPGGRRIDPATLRAALPEHRRAEATTADLAALDRARRTLFGPATGAGLDSYAPMAWALLGNRDGATPSNLAALLDLVHSVRTSGRRARFGLHRWRARMVTAERLAGAARGRYWPGDARPVEGVAHEPEHDGLVPGLQYVHDVTHLTELRDWLVSLLPVPGGVLPLATLKSALTWGFTASLDEGVPVEIKAGGETYVVRIFTDVMGRPLPEQGSKPSARLETRVNVIDETVRSGVKSRSRYLDPGAAGRFGTRVVVSLFLSGGAGRSKAKGRSFVLNNATAAYTYFKPSDPVASLAMPVAFSAAVSLRDDTTARWRYETWLDEQGAVRTETVRTYVGQTQLPRADTVRTDLRGHPRRLPLWDMHGGVERISGLRALRAKLRERLGAEEYAFWADEIEMFLGQDRMSGLVLDAYNPAPGFQEVPRLTLRSGDRYLNLSLAAEATAVEKSGKGTKKVIVDKIKAALTKPQAGRDRRGAWRWGFVASLRTALGLFSLGTRMSWSSARGRQSVRSQKSYTLRAIRAADPSRVIKVDTEFRLDANWGNDGPTPSSHTDSVSAAGFTQVRVRQAEMARTFDHYRPPTDPPVGDQPAGAAPAIVRSWWAPTNDGRHGLGYGTPTGVTGLDELYNSLVTYLIGQGMLPAAAAGPEGTTPWQHLQSLDRTGRDLNGPGVEHVNWRRLVDRISDRVITRRIDDLTSGTTEEPGLTIVFTDASGHSLTVGLSGVVGGTGRYRADDDLWTLNSFSGQDGSAMRRTSARTRDRTVDGSLVADNGDAEIFHDAVPIGDAASVTFGRRRGSRSGESIAGNAQSAAALEEHSSLFEVPLRLHWFAYREGSRTAVVGAGAPPAGFAATVKVWQADSYAQVGSSHQPLPELDTTGEASPLVGITPRAAVSVSGLAALRTKMLKKVDGRLRVADVVEGFSATHYKANQMNALQGGVAVLTGAERSMLQIEPFGKPQILKKVRAYNDYTLETQTGDMRDGDEVRTRSWRNTIGYRTGLPSDSGGALLGGGSGQGSAQSADRTAGSYRAWTGMNDLYVVRTAARNRVTFENGTEVVQDGEVILMLATREVHAQGKLDQYDDPFGLLTAPAAASKPTTTRQPPRSVREGRPWTGVFLDTIGVSPLQQAVGDAGRRMGGPKLRIRLLQQLVGLMSHQSQLTDDGKAWEVRANGDTYELLVKVELPDAATYVGEAERDRLKLYTRRNQASTRQRSRMRMRTVGAAGSKSTVPDEDTTAAQALRDAAKTVTEDDVAAPVSFSLTGTITSSEARGAAGNMLTMTGERPQGAAQFEQPVRFTFELKRVDGVRHALGFGATEKGTVTEPADTGKLNQRPVKKSVTETRTMYSLVDGSRPDGQAAPDLSGVALGQLPDGAKIHGIHALAAIADTVSTGPSSGRARKVAAGELELALQPEEVLTSDTLVTDFPSMQTADGVRYAGINTGARRLRLPKGVVVRAAFGRIRDAYHVRSAELEAYDHGTQGVTSTSGQTVRRAFDGAIVVTSPVKPLVRGGGRVAAGGDRIRGETFGAVRATEHRSWLRSIPKDGVYHIYADVVLTLTTGDSPPRTVPATIEFSVDHDGARQLGLTDDDLNRIRVPHPDEAPVTDTRDPRTLTLGPIVETDPERVSLEVTQRNAGDYPRVVPVPGDQDCLFHAVPLSAAQQGVALPVADVTGRALRTRLAALAREDPARFAQALDRSPAEILAADATADQLIRLLPDYAPSVTPEKLAELRTSEVHRRQRDEARRRGLSDVDTRPITDLQADLAGYQPTISDDRTGELADAYRTNLRREELARRLTRDPQATVAAIGRVYGEAGDMPGPTALAAFYAEHGNRLPTAGELVIAALDRSPLWNSALGDDTPRIVAVGLGINLAVVSDGHTEQLNPDALLTVYVHRGGNHFDALAPATGTPAPDDLTDGRPDLVAGWAPGPDPLPSPEVEFDEARDAFRQRLDDGDDPVPLRRSGVFDGLPDADRYQVTARLTLTPAAPGTGPETVTDVSIVDSPEGWRALADAMRAARTAGYRVISARIQVHPSTASGLTIHTGPGLDVTAGQVQAQALLALALAAAEAAPTADPPAGGTVLGALLARRPDRAQVLALLLAISEVRQHTPAGLWRALARLLAQRRADPPARP